MSERPANATDALISALVKAGIDIVEAAGMVARAGAEMAAGPSKGALRTRKWRAGQVSQNVTGDAEEAPEPIVTKRHKASQNVTSDSASISKKENKDTESKKKRESRASQLPDGWRSSPEAWEETIGILGTAERCEYELKKFKNHALEKGRVGKNWNAAWINWAIRAVEFAGQNGKQNHGKAQDNPRAGSLIGAIDRRLAALEIEGKSDLAMPADNLLRLPDRSVQRS